MTIFVGDKPSRLNIDPKVPFIGTPSHKNLMRWVESLQIHDYRLLNSYTEEDKRDILAYSNQTFIALGNSASKVLHNLGIPHFKLPHPSPKNRKLNDKIFVDEILHKCYKYIKGSENVRYL